MWWNPTSSKVPALDSQQLSLHWLQPRPTTSRALAGTALHHRQPNVSLYAWIRAQRWAGCFTHDQPMPDESSRGLGTQAGPSSSGEQGNRQVCDNSISTAVSMPPCFPALPVSPQHTWLATTPACVRASLSG